MILACLYTPPEIHSPCFWHWIKLLRIHRRSIQLSSSPYSLDIKCNWLRKRIATHIQRNEYVTRENVRSNGPWKRRPKEAKWFIYLATTQTSSSPPRPYILDVVAANTLFRAVINDVIGLLFVYLSPNFLGMCWASIGMSERIDKTPPSYTGEVSNIRFEFFVLLFFFFFSGKPSSSKTLHTICRSVAL